MENILVIVLLLLFITNNYSHILFLYSWRFNTFLSNRKGREDLRKAPKDSLSIKSSKNNGFAFSVFILLLRSLRFFFAHSTVNHFLPDIL